MIYLSCVTTPTLARVLAERGVGIILSPAAGLRTGMVRLYPHVAFDNGCFSQGEAFDLDRFLGWIGALRPSAGERCLFAVAPDVVADAAATWARSEPVLPVLRSLGYPAALVAQDGIEELAVEWEAFDVLFVGGSTEWKLSEAAIAVVAEAKARGKWVHMGRVNSRRRLLWARNAGCDSADGTMLAFGPDKRAPQLLRWLDELRAQPHLEFALAVGGTA